MKNLILSLSALMLLSFTTVACSHFSKHGKSCECSKEKNCGCQKDEKSKGTCADCKDK